MLSYQGFSGSTQSRGRTGNEGLIIGHSLDMFISKLRKKLELDPNIKIAVIRGKGYKLEVS